MSQSELSEGKGWISGASLAIPRQHLHESEVEAFLEFLFGDIAERPEELTVREAASVVRYLSLLELRGVPSDVAHRSNKEIEEYLAAEPKEERRQGRIVGHVAQIIWGEVSQHARIKPSGKAKALRFLRKYASYFRHYSETVVEFVEAFDLPPKTLDPFSYPPGFRSKTRTGGGNRRAKNDLSERIYAAYHALRRENTKRSRQRIAGALQRLNVKPSSRRTSRQTGWCDENVNDRLKQFERRRQKEIRKQSGQEITRLFESWRDGFVDGWIADFRWICQGKETGHHLQPGNG
jgi:hypothetical protein